MTLRILDLAEADLLRGFRFYERKSQGVGWLDTLSAEIESNAYCPLPLLTSTLTHALECLMAVGYS